ncbi:MAG TPA: ribosome biogenesis GTPase YlqF [Burkholderiales bacterium]|nr:ribosome biogenesis GTPase YlqF [Burkholderiales bacterium]
MSIEWFPGHMAAARKKAAETMAKIDVVVELVDARLPAASSNPLIERLRKARQRPCLKILNKADLADPEATSAWLRHYGSADVKAVALSCKKPGDVAKVPRLAASLVPHRDSPLKPVRMLVMGVPNVGKSTLINALLKRKVAKTGDEPAVTRQQSRFQLDDRTDLIDTPGLMPPAIRHASDGLMLAASHIIGADAYIDEEVGTFLADILLERYPGLVRTRYDVEPAGMDGYRLISEIAARRGYLRKGGKPDYEKAARALMQDYRSGLLGRISLETPQSRALRLSGDAAPQVS